MWHVNDTKPENVGVVTKYYCDSGVCLNMVGGLGQKYTKYLAVSVLRNCEMEGGDCSGPSG